MRKQDHLLSRRAFAGSALATATLLAAKGAGAATTKPMTPGQTIGPFYPVERLAEADADLTWIKGHQNRAKGTVIEVTGRVLDRYGNPVRGAKLELWQCNAAGRYAHPNDVATAPLDPDFQGFANIATGNDGEWRITTIKPAGYASPIGHRTPHIHFDVSGRTHRLITQMYFSDEEATNAKDALYMEMGKAATRTVARADGVARYAWDIVLMDG
jgi:protocatechuate 3,4-dioxygenase beta subunit